MSRYSDDFNDRLFNAWWGDAPDHLAADFLFIEERADEILAEMVQAVRSVVANHGLSFFHEALDVLKQVLYDEFLYDRVKVSQDAIRGAGHEPPEPRYVTVARLQALGTKEDEPMK